MDGKGSESYKETLASSRLSAGKSSSRDNATIEQKQ